MAYVTHLRKKDTTSGSHVNVVAEYSFGTNSIVLASRRSDGTGPHKQVLEFNRAQAHELHKILGEFLNS
ncbi:MAG: hypothetical protein EOO56_05615 [Hymenobacter sp.]|nr:MAG: hypothetical protein EOO56_05615 [Hymenobacter sp.]